ncbi:MAG: AAA domain-containing protein [Chitinophagales bacterium]|nr:AAA domain-containing protein [Chitinophagales bacterium]
MNKKSLFIEKIIQKLKVGDQRSIYLDAVPSRYARLDITNFSQIEPELTFDFLKKILSSQNFSFQIQIEPSKYSLLPIEERKNVQKISKKLNTLYYQSQDELAEYGTESFGLGYPMLAIPDPSNPNAILKAPLLIWKLEISKTTASSNTWTIKRTDRHEVTFNELLLNHFKQYLGEYWQNPFSNLDTEELNLDTVQQICNIVTKGLQLSEEKLSIAKVSPCESKETIEKWAPLQPKIIQVGILGLYKSQKQSIIEDLLQLQYFNEEEEIQYIEDTQNNFLTPIALDPSQEAVLHTLYKHKKVIIQGPPGTGKSQALTAIITNALLENKKVLVVCEKRTALDVIRKNLSQIGLDSLIALIEDVYKDRNTVVQNIRQQLEEYKSNQSSSFKSYQFEETKNQFLKFRDITNQRIEALYQKSFGDDNWIEVAERHTQLTKNLNLTTHEPLSPLGDNQSYFEQYQEWKNNLIQHQELISRVALILSAIHLLPKEWWLKHNENDIETFHHFHQKGLELKTFIEQSEKDLGTEFLHLKFQNKIKTGFLFLFSNRQKQIRQARKTALLLFQEWASLGIKTQWNITHLNAQQDFQSLKEISEIIDEALKISTPVDKIIDQLSLVHTWINYQSQNPQQFSTFIEKIAQFPPQERLERLEEWYKGYFLMYYAKDNFLYLDGDDLLKDLKAYYTQTNELLNGKIIELWDQKAQNAIKNTADISAKKLLYNLRKNRQFNQRNSLRAILQNDFDFFSTIFPVIMVNPLTASSILPLQKDLFDIIILDEASQLRIEDTYAVLHRARYHVISGDEHQMPPSSYFSADVDLQEDTEELEEEIDIFLAQSSSLLEFASDAGYEMTYLDFHYRSQHPDLIAFSNASVYQSRLIPMPAKKSYQSIHFHTVNGIYSNRSNIEEAQEVVAQLFQIAEDNQETMPSVGIGTLNLQQRDVIQDLIWEQAYQYPHKAELLDKLSQAGLFIKNLENIQGDEKDIILISTTFGKDTNGSFRQNFGPINRQQGYKLLNVLITRAKKNIHIFCSIPEEYYQKYEDEIIKTGNTGKGLFYAYLAYVRAVSENNIPQKTAILNSLQKQQAKTILKNNQKDIALPDYVLNQINEQIQLPLKTQLKLGGFTLEALFKETLNKPVYLQTEQASRHPATHYKYMIYKDDVLKNYSLLNHKIWAYQWWREPNYEIKKVSTIINAMTKSSVN